MMNWQDELNTNPEELAAVIKSLEDEIAVLKTTRKPALAAELEEALQVILAARKRDEAA